MKRNMLAAMDKLKIDDRVRDLIRQLWKHCYRTSESCEGHDKKAYVMFSGGDGWFEENSWRYGLTIVENKDCCQREFQDEIRKYCLDPKKVIDRRKVCGCGAGVNGYSIYRGRLVQNPFKPTLEVQRRSD